LKQTLKVGAMLLVVAALTTTGIALAQSGSDTSVFSTTADSAAATDETAVADDTPLRARILEWLAPLVDDDTITDEQAQAVADTLAEHLPRLRHEVGRGLVAVQEAADFLGLTGRELLEALRDGATLAEVAQINGVEPDALIEHLVGVAAERLDQAVADGRLSEDEAAARLTEATEQITALVNGELGHAYLGEGGPGMGPGPGMGRGPGMGNGPCGHDDADSGTSDLGA
jgi:hypothetical protein